MNTHTIILTALAATTAIATTTHAWTISGRRIGNGITMRASSSSFPWYSGYRDSLRTVVDRFNESPSNLHMTQRFGDRSVSLYNGQNEVWFDDGLCPPSALGVTYYNFDLLLGGALVESDVVFRRSGVPWTPSMDKRFLNSYFNGIFQGFQEVALHEYGHATGLGHEDDEYNCMGLAGHLSLKGNTCRAYVGEDAGDGLVELYGRALGVDRQDIGVTHMRRTGRQNGYSRHGFCTIFPGGSATPLTPIAFPEGQPQYRTLRNRPYRVQFTYENNGETSRRVNIGFYLSANPTIDTSDTFLGSTTMSLRRNNVATTARTVTIPNVALGNTRYYLGVIVDRNNAIAEVTEDNNTAYHIVLVPD